MSDVTIDWVKLELYRLGLAAEPPPGLPPGTEEIEKCLAAGDGWGAICLLHANPGLCKQPLAASQVTRASALMGSGRKWVNLIEQVPGTERANLWLLAWWDYFTFPVVRRFLDMYPSELVRACRQLATSMHSEDLTTEEHRLSAAIEAYVNSDPGSFADEEVSPGWEAMRHTAELVRNYHVGWYEWPTALEANRHGYVVFVLAYYWRTYHRSNSRQADSWIRQQVDSPEFHYLVCGQAIRGIWRHRSPLLSLQALIKYIRCNHRVIKAIRKVRKLRAC